ncbi:MAG: GGDEF domain-containing protein [Lachnospiraceae bacterium]|nr:GGDEF domain-containing protein [Lachnospiraceae bacterium]
MDELKYEVRRKMVGVLKYIWLAGIIAEIIFYLVLKWFGDYGMDEREYLVKRCFLPIIFFSLSYYMAYYIDNSKKTSEDRKNYLCTLSLCIFGACIGIFHGYFVPLWISPVIAVVYSTVFPDKKIRMNILHYSITFCILAYVYRFIEEPDNIVTYTVNLLICVIIIIVTCISAVVVQNYNTSLLAATHEYYSKQLEYRDRLEKDALTGVHSRSFFKENVEKYLKESVDGDVVAMTILDIDNFKHINDTYGHANGDIVLKRLGEILNSEEEGIMPARFGGEEFVLFMTDRTAQEYKAIIERMLAEFYAGQYDFTDEHISFSAGIVTMKSRHEYTELFNAADKLMYKAKASGKNMVLEEGLE